jgi:hypothetical protein
MISGPLKWYTVASAIRDAVFSDLTVKPDRSGVVPGSIAWDECDCGLLAVSLSQVFLSDSFPDPQTARAGARCDAAWEVGEFAVQLIRCAPGPDGQSLAPTTAELDASAQLVQQDLYELLRAASELLCTMTDASDIVDFLMLPGTAQGPSGGCVGNEVRVYVGLPRN